MHGNGFERTRSSPRVSPRVVRLLAGDALDMVAPLGSAMPIARVRRRAAVAPCEGESPGPLRTLPVTALAHAPGAAVLIRFTLPCAGTLDVGALSQRLAELAVPSALLDALVRALRVARMDRAGGGLRWAASDAEGCGGLVHGTALAAVARDALPDALGPAVAGCVRLGLDEAHAHEEWSGRLRSGLAHHPRRVLLMRGEALAVSMDVASGAARLSREGAGEAVPGALALLDAAPALASHAGARHRFDISSAEDALALDLGALVSLLHAPSLRARLVQWRTALLCDADPGASLDAVRRHLDALAVGAVFRLAPMEEARHSTTTSPRR